jgi:hypothetical protein
VQTLLKQFWPHGEGDAYLYATMRLALAVAVLSFFFEEMGDMLDYSEDGRWFLAASIALMPFTVLLVLHEKYSRLGVILFTLLAIGPAYDRWYVFANHSWLALWTVCMAGFFSKWWEEESYSRYLSVTLGVVMLAAAGQKLVMGTYIDGSYITFLSYAGSTTEQAFGFLCNRAEAMQNGCFAHKFLGSFIVVWQIVVGVLLIAGLRNVWFLCIEIGFLIGAGFYADEMNFQILNIAILCVAFRAGMPKWLFWIALPFLFIDLHGIGRFINEMGF